MKVEIHTVNKEEVAEVTTSGPDVFVFDDAVVATHVDGRMIIDAPHGANPAYYAYRVALLLGREIEWRAAFFIESGVVRESDLVETRRED